MSTTRYCLSSPCTNAFLATSSLLRSSSPSWRPLQIRGVCQIRGTTHHHHHHRHPPPRRRCLHECRASVDNEDSANSSPSLEEETKPQPLTQSPPPYYERLFSNLNESSLKHEPGSLSSSILLIAGTTVGAGILAIPAVTEDAGFLASTVTCLFCWLYMVGTGLLIAEVNVNTMCELGSGGVSLVSMAMRTLGVKGVRIAGYSGSIKTFYLEIFLY